MTAFEQSDPPDETIRRIVLENQEFPPEHLLTLSGIARKLNISRQRAWQLTKKRDFPPVVQRTPNGPLWSLYTVEAWLQTHRPPPEAPSQP